MSRVRVHNIVVSLDGYATGEGQSLDAPFGDAQEQMGEWFARARIWRGTQTDPSALSADDLISDGWGKGVGAEIIGRRMFWPLPGPWPDEDWKGWWGENPPFHTPCFVLTHYPRKSIEMQGGTTFHFINATPAEALKRAQDAANGLDVRVGGGPTTIQQFLAADLIDHLHIVLIPVVLGGGIRLWDGLDKLEQRFAIESMSTPSGVTRFTLTRRDGPRTN